MTHENILTKVKTIVSQLLNIDTDDVEIKSDFYQELGANSLDHVEICMAVEEEFNIHVTDEEMDNIKTVGDLINLIQSKHGI